MKTEVLRLFYKLLKKISRDNIARYMRNHFEKEYDALLEMTKQLNKFDSGDKNKKISIFERIYFLEHNMLDRPKCKHCHANYVCGFNKQKNEYKKWCSAKCQASDPECVNESKLTRLRKYGDANFNNINTARATRLANNGSWHAGNFGDKVKAGKVKNGHPANWVNPELSKETRKNRYGDANFNNGEKNKLTRKTNFYNNILANDSNIIPLFSLEDYINGNKNTAFAWKCKKCGNEFQQKLNYNFKCNDNREYRVRCIKCFPYNEVKTSDGELQLFNFIKTIDSNCIHSDRQAISPDELDVYCPDEKLAFEFDGLYWHSDENKNNNYHLYKTEKCAEKGITLVHVFENEWNTKCDIVKSRIKNMFGAYGKTIFARKCRVKQIETKISKDFQDENHIQGAVNSNVNIGLYYNDELISVMTFGKCRFDKRHEWEMLRFCCKLGYHVPGGAGKLLKYFETAFNPKSLVTYADRRWSVGKLYCKLGFRLDHMSKPDYWYFKCWADNKLISRINCQKHKLKGKLETFDETKSEVENMKANGYSRIFDCGNMVFEKTY